MPVTVGNWQNSHELTNLTHLDGRNADKVSRLRPYFSELAWMKERLYVLVSHLILIAPIVAKPIGSEDKKKLRKIADSFSLADGERVRRLEKEVNHDLKALELFLAHVLPRNLKPMKRFILFGLGSEDINSIALARLVTRGRGEVLLPELVTLARAVADMSKNEKNTGMVGRTHGLPAGLTTLGKELAVPLSRLCDEITICASASLQAKASGETGSLHSLETSSARVDWLAFGDRFVRSLGAEPSHASTQIVPYDSLVRFLQSLFRINTILIDLSKNMWLYVLLGYLRVMKKEREVGSSGMPHKVNPIYFEGAEGGLIMANGIIEVLARTLMVNRLQRDFSDSTLRRNISLIYAYSLLSYQSLSEAFKRLEVQKEAIARDITEHAEVWIEPVKIVMLGAGYDDAYELLRKKTRGKSFSSDELLSLVSSLQTDNKTQKRLQRLIQGEAQNPYPARMVDEAVSKLNNLKII